MKAIFLLFLPLIFYPTLSFAENPESLRPLGHSFSHTDYLADGHKATAGLQALGIPFPNMLLATSPYLLYEYNMWNLYFRRRVKEGERWIQTIEVAYFKGDRSISARSKDRYALGYYSMEAFWGYYIWTLKLPNKNKLHINTNLNYYSTDKFPFSLHRPTMDRSPFQLNQSVLLEAHLTDSVSLLSELGLLHLNDEYPRVQAGASIFKAFTHWTLQVGFSMTATIDGLFVDHTNQARQDYQQELRWRPEGFYGPLERQKVKEDFALHPEIFFQYYF